MSHVSENVSNAIRVLDHPRGGFVIRIGSDAMLELMPIFETESAYSNGPAWDPRMSGYERTMKAQ